MRRFVLTVMLLIAAAPLLGGPGRSLAAPAVKAATAAPAPVKLAGVTWEASFAKAQARARAEGKPILLLHLLGRLDEEFC